MLWWCWQERVITIWVLASHSYCASRWWCQCEVRTCQETQSCTYYGELEGRGFLQRKRINTGVYLNVKDLMGFVVSFGGMKRFPFRIIPSHKSNVLEDFTQANISSKKPKALPRTVRKWAQVGGHKRQSAKIALYENILGSGGVTMRFTLRGSSSALGDLQNYWLSILPKEADNLLWRTSILQSVPQIVIYNENLFCGYIGKPYRASPRVLCVGDKYTFISFNH